MRAALIIFCLSCLGALSGRGMAVEPIEGLQESIVRVAVSFQAPNTYHPWRWSSPMSKAGQGLVVGPKLVLTLASTVANATLIEMRLGAEPLSTPLEVVLKDIDRNLALLKGDLPAGVRPFKVPGDNPVKIGSDIHYYWKTETGRFLGGSAKLDRAESSMLSSSFQEQVWLAATQSTIRGGYGEPVFQGDRMIGIGTQAEGSADFAVIPNAVIHAGFDLAEGLAQPTTAMCGFSVTPCIQPGLRAKLGVGDEEGGCVISKIYGQGSGVKILQAGDVLLSLAEHPIDAWGRLESKTHGTQPFQFLFAMHRLDQKMEATWVRDGKKMNLPLDLGTISDHNWLIPHFREGEPSPYIVRGGFVFQTLSYSYLKAWGDEWFKKGPEILLVALEKYRTRVRDESLQDIVVFSHVLAHPVNRGFQNLGQTIVESVDGAPLKSLRQLLDILNDETEDVVRLSLLPGHTPLYLSKRILRSADPDIQIQYSIPDLNFFPRGER